MSDDPLLSVRNLEKHYPITEGVLRREVGRVRAVDGISFDVGRGEVVGLVGESGCGKSTAARTVLRLEEPTGGRVVFDGEDIGEYDRTALKRFRRRAGMIFQDPTSSFDPRMTVGESVVEPLTAHGLSERERRRAIAEDLFERVGLPAADYDRYPHEFSGGQKQRLALARALILDPDLLIADEPVSALDVSVQAEILTLVSDLQRDLALSVVLITHDLIIVREVCDRVAVMYLGEIVEIGPTEGVFRDPQHPYTRALVAAVPTPNPRANSRDVELAGDVPDASSPPSGCRFHTRCPAVIQPEDYELDQEHWRHVMDFRLRVADRDIDVPALRDRIVANDDAPTADQVPDTRLRTAIREEYDLPNELTDKDAEGVLTAALNDIAAGDMHIATERLRAFTTVCEQRQPDLQATSGDHPAACHLHDSAVQASFSDPTLSSEDNPTK
jgi:peptide/nickel transport system ATP-binding protein